MVSYWITGVTGEDFNFAISSISPHAVGETINTPIIKQIWKWIARNNWKINKSITNSRCNVDKLSIIIMICWSANAEFSQIQSICTCKSIKASFEIPFQTSEMLSQHIIATSIYRYKKLPSTHLILRYIYILYKTLKEYKNFSYSLLSPSERLFIFFLHAVLHVKQSISPLWTRCNANESTYTNLTRTCARAWHKTNTATSIRYTN